MTGKGGYQIVDFRGVTVSGTLTTIDGIYNQIKTGVGKPLLLTNLSLGVQPGKFFDNDAYWANCTTQGGELMLCIIFANNFTEYGVVILRVRANDGITAHLNISTANTLSTEEVQ